ncbi:MAG TPA: hypothetical protein ENK75_04350 [Saprospiraceae bacterium]|nr:hypothetical protein [Saprospiraceae bacterium]
MTFNISNKNKAEMKEKLDKTYFKKQTFKEADNSVAYWRSKTAAERLEAAYILSLRAYGYDPVNPLKLDKTYFRKRKRK